MKRLVPVLCLLSACSSSYDYCSPEDRREFEPTIDTSGEVPSFEWTPGDASVITVFGPEYQDQGDPQYWHIGCIGGATLEESACIPSGIAYGDTPSSEFFDTKNTTNAKALTSGEEYSAMVVSWTASDSESCGVMYWGESTFIAP